MKILLVSTSDQFGGAAIAAYRLHQSLRTCHMDCRLLALHKYRDDPSVIGPTGHAEKIVGMARSWLDRTPLRLYPKRSQTYFSSGLLPFGRVAEKINRLNPDIVHLNWICGGMVSISELARIKAPIVWSLHDMWAFTGGCHYDEGCAAYQDRCGRCKVLGSRNENDLSRLIMRTKEKAYNRIPDLTIVGLSRWIAECSKKSHLLQDVHTVHLPNTIDTQAFKPIDSMMARRQWRLPMDKKLVLFGAMAGIADHRKGYKEFSQALTRLMPEDIDLVVFGGDRSEAIDRQGFRTYFVGHVQNEARLMALYNAVDVFVLPSLQENLSNVVLESLACGTPVVAFDIGGNRDMIEHKQNGYLATPFEADSFAHGIAWAVDEAVHKKTFMKAREKVLREFDSKVIVDRYINLYKSILNRHDRSYS